jgi:sporulation protein YqfC
MKRLDHLELTGNTVVEIAGTGRVLVENHRGVTQYSDEMIGVRVKYGQVCVCGSRLKLAQMTCSRLVICGCIDSVTLEKGRT